MLGSFLLVGLIVSILMIIVFCLINEHTESILWGNISFVGFICFIIIGVFSFAGGVVYLGETSERTPHNYYNYLETKQTITEGLIEHKEEIDNVLKADVNNIEFTKSSELIELNNQINRYNEGILKHRKYKDSFWLHNLYNKNIADLKLFQPIFNRQE